MRRALIALPLLALTLTGCGGGSGEATKTVTISASPLSTALSDTPLNNMRTELDRLDIPCVSDSDWTPAVNGEYEGADTAGVCGKNRAVITTHSDGKGLYLPRLASQGEGHRCGRRERRKHRGRTGVVRPH